MIRRVIFVFLLGVVTHISVFGQWVTITDTLFADWLGSLQWPCTSGNQLDTTCPELLAATTLTISPGSGIKNINGIRYFKNLEELVCRQNQLIELKSLPPRLKSLDCSYNKIEYIELPDSLRALRVGGNKIDSLVSIPLGLTFLHCDGNELTYIDTLPDSLNWMSCRLNKLTQLPNLPSTLNWLSCEGNNIDSLPLLPQSLRSLHCGANKLYQVPQLPDSLDWFACYDNFIDSLPALPSTLVDLMCWNNAIKVLPAIPMGLNGLVCYGNQLSEIPSLPPVMDVLDIHNNTGITCLPYLKKVNTLYFGGTSISCIPSYIDIGMSYPTIFSNFLCNSSNNTYNCPLYISGFNDLSDAAFFVGPNPAGNFVEVEVSAKTESVALVVTDIMGRKIFEQTLQNSLNNIDISALNAGTYLFSCKTSSAIFNRRVVKE